MMPDEYKKRISELSEILGIGDELFNPIKTFSGGMKRKLEIVRSLMHKPKVLFLDEPTSGLDPISRANLWSYLKQVRENEHTTIFLTTHYLEEAEEADRLCIINQGRVIALGSPKEIKGELSKSSVVFSSNHLDALQNELLQKQISFNTVGQDLIANIEHDNIAHVIQSIATPLTKLEMHNATLDDAYLRIIGDSLEKQEQTT